MNHNTEKVEMTLGKTFGALIGAAIVAGLAVGAVAQQSHDMDGMPGMQGQGVSPMMQSMQRMNRDMMAVPQTGDPDQDFVAMMIPHHQGAIDMAKAELATGKDPEMRKLAEDIVKAQETEIMQMRAWQQKHPVRP
jgi:uncharacterized protein (DUF305 family)